MLQGTNQLQHQNAQTNPLHQNMQQQNQQQQQQQQQQMMQQNQQPQGNQQIPANAVPPPPPQNGQDLTLSSVLHFLQTEWRRYERDRNEWEIERAEMRARIALLEGERRSFENVKLDLMRRIKMLEYALRMERSKQLNQALSGSVPPAKLAAIQAQAAKDDVGSHKAGSGSSSPHSEDSPLPPESRIPNGLPSRNDSVSVPPAFDKNSVTSGQPPQAVLGKPPLGRDPKSRARSRDYLKACLLEVSYYISPAAMNPLPNRPLITNPAVPLTLPNVPSFDPMIFNGRPRKTMPDGNSPLISGMSLMSGPSSAPSPVNGQPQNLERSNPMGGTAALLAIRDMHQQQREQHQQQMIHHQHHQQQHQQQQNHHQPPSHQQQQNNSHPVDRECEVTEQRTNTAIFRPDNSGEWREQLRRANEAAEQHRNSDVINQDDDEENEDGETDEDDASGSEDDEGKKMWKAKRTLRNHLDAVRALAFHPTELCIATGADDCTVKIWRMDVASLASSATRATTEVEPQLTLRGHSGPITRLIHSPSKQLLYSASLDSSIRVWALPSTSHTTYAPYDETCARGELIGHTDAVWDLALVRDESTLISGGAEGAVKVWDVSGPSGGGSLKLSWGSDGLDYPEDTLGEGKKNVQPGATSVEAMKSDLKKVAIAYQNSIVKIFDIESGKELSKLASDATYDGTPATQINRIVSHPTMPLLVTAHEDKYIRIFDILTGECLHSMVSHLDGVTSLSIDPSGFSLVSGSHDCSVRFWDIMGSRTCLQEITSHREKAREGVLDVEFHPSLPFMASAGADGVIKLYASS